MDASITLITLYRCPPNTHSVVYPPTHLSVAPSSLFFFIISTHVRILWAPYCHCYNEPQWLSITLLFWDYKTAIQQMKAEWSTLCKRSPPSSLSSFAFFFSFFFYISDSIQLCNILAMFSRGEKRLFSDSQGGHASGLNFQQQRPLFSGDRLVKERKKGGGGAVLSTGLRGKHFKQMLKCANLGRSWWSHRSDNDWQRWCEKK